MSSNKVSEAEQSQTSRQRWSREKRYNQLISIAWRIIRNNGTDALTLGHLAEEAKVTKPVVYSHFDSRNRLLGTLYMEFVDKQNKMIDAALLSSGDTLEDKIQVIATAHIDCVLAQGREIPGLEAALLGSPELEKIRLDAEDDYVEKCRGALAPYTPSNNIEYATMCAIFGAANGLAYSVSSGKLPHYDAQNELYLTILAVIGHQSCPR